MLNLAIVAVMLFSEQKTVAQAQISHPTKAPVYAALPDKERDSFRAGLEKWISLREARKWEEMYSIYDNEDRLKQEQFIRQHKKLNALRKFTPISVFYVPPSNHWVVTGCAVFDKPIGKGAGVVSSIHVLEKTDGWRFSDVAIELRDPRDVPGGMEGCTP